MKFEFPKVVLMMYVELHCINLGVRQEITPFSGIDKQNYLNDGSGFN